MCAEGRALPQGSAHIPWLQRARAKAEEALSASNLGLLTNGASANVLGFSMSGVFEASWVFSLIPVANSDM